MNNKQRGGLVLGLILGVLVGLAAALAVAVYVTKVPVPFLNKNATRGADQDEAEAQRNKNWDPNATLYGKNPAKPAASSSAAQPDATTSPPAVTGTVTPAPAPTPAPTQVAPAPTPVPPTTTTATASAPRASAPTKPAQTTSSDPLGDLAALVRLPHRLQRPCRRPMIRSITLCKPVPSALRPMPTHSGPSSPCWAGKRV